MRPAPFLAIAAAGLWLCGSADAQPTTPLDRLPATVLDARPPSERVTGAPGAMSIQAQPCRTLPLTQARRRIVELAVQEWGYFGFPIVEYDADEDDDARPSQGRGGPGRGGRGRGPSRIGTPEAARTAASIAGYWAIAPGGAWILESQNEYWREAISGVTRWRFPWSAAFLSWLMCEGGLGTAELFQPAIAHHTYIDQAIRNRDASAPRGAYVAYDMGERAIVAGDLLCTSRRPVFRTLADRRRQLGEGARSHCDLVVKVDEGAGRILAIGGNVRGVVGLKVFPAVRTGDTFQPVLPIRLAEQRPMFAHLKLRGDAAALDAFDQSPTVRRITCASSTEPISSVQARALMPAQAACAD